MDHVIEDEYELADLLDQHMADHDLAFKSVYEYLDDGNHGTADFADLIADLDICTLRDAIAEFCE